MQASAQSLPPGMLLQNRYQIQKLLGQGGMSRVYLATDLRLNTRVAVKENLQSDPQARDQFRREAQILARLTHPNLPRVMDNFDDAATGRQYLVMDYIEGEDLDAMVKRVGPLPETSAIAWIQQVLAAVDYLHSQQPPVIHRDIKPSNIKITPQGKAVLVDFGIAKTFEGSGQTMTGARAATPGYAPPEQYGMRTDQRSDIYAVGATLYTLVTGKQPPESTLRMSNLAMLTPPRQLTPRLSPNVERAILVAMELDASRRWPRAKEFRSALAISTIQPPPMKPTVQAGPEAMPTRVAAPARPPEIARVAQVPNPRVHPVQPAQAASVPPAVAAPAPKSRGWLGAVTGGLVVLVVVAVGVLLATNAQVASWFTVPTPLVVVVVPTETPRAAPTPDFDATHTALSASLNATRTAEVSGFQVTPTAEPKVQPSATLRVAPPATQRPSPVLATSAPLPPPTVEPTVVPATRRVAPPTSTPAPPADSPTPSPLPALPTPAVAPGVYVTQIRIEPARPNRGNPITFFATFLNTTGAPAVFDWQIQLFDPDKPNSIGSSKLLHGSIPQGQSEQTSANDWRVTGPGACVSFIARAYYQDPDHHSNPFRNTDGSTVNFYFQVCPAQ